MLSSVLGSARLLPIGTSLTGRRERRGGPSWPAGSGLTGACVETRKKLFNCVQRRWLRVKGLTGELWAQLR